VRRRSAVIGQSVRAADLRAQYNAAVLAVKRGAKRSPQPLAEVVLEAGDVLVLQAGEQVRVYGFMVEMVRMSIAGVGGRGGGATGSLVVWRTGPDPAAHAVQHALRHRLAGRGHMQSCHTGGDAADGVVHSQRCAPG
jgi:TrkA-C domain